MYALKHARFRLLDMSCLSWLAWDTNIALLVIDGIIQLAIDIKTEGDHTSGEKPLSTQSQGSAVLLQCCGLIVDEPCDFCAKHPNPFQSCVAAPMYNLKALHKGSCANCICSNRLGTPGPKQGSILWNMEPAKRALTAKGVEYGFIGGAASYTYGQLRMTKAVDILVPDGQVRLARHALRDNSRASSAFLLQSRGRIAAELCKTCAKNQSNLTSVRLATRERPSIGALGSIPIKWNTFSELALSIISGHVSPTALNYYPESIAIGTFAEDNPHPAMCRMVYMGFTQTGRIRMHLAGIAIDGFESP